MTQELKSLRLRQVDESIRPWSRLSAAGPPRGGWVKSIRQALGMSTAQLGRRMGVTRQGVTDLERRETQRAVTLAALERAAQALDADLVYAIVPRTGLAEMVREQARKTADAQLNRVAHSMRLEDQGVSSEEHASQVADIQERLLHTWSRHIWDEGDSATRDGI